MIECYYKECMYHSKDEPFCTKDKCKATEEQLVDLNRWRVAWLSSQREAKQDD